MSIEAQCGGCGKRFAAPEQYAGQRVKCPACGGVLEVPRAVRLVQPLEDLPTRPTGRVPVDPRSAGRGAPAGAVQPRGLSPSAPVGFPAQAPLPIGARLPLTREQPGLKDTLARHPLLVTILAVLGVGVFGCLVFAVVRLASRAPAGPGSPPAASASADFYPSAPVPGSSPAAQGSVPAPLPVFPDRGPMRLLMPGVEFTEVRLPIPPGQPGHQSLLYVYLPPGQRAPRSLPCVLIAPAGTTLLHGMALGQGDQAEHTPYVLAGFAVVSYELDGPLADAERASASAERRAYERFSAARAGLVNARNALEYVLAKMPEVDPERLYAAGHSSAATLALLFAEHEPRIKACVAYAPCVDLVQRFRPHSLRLRMSLPGSTDFIAQSSPRTHEARLQCPLFLFHARDDSNVPFQESEQFAQRMRQLGKPVTFEAANSGNHYDSMISEGIPRGIIWLLARSGRMTVPAKPAPPAAPIAVGPTPPPPTGIPPNEAEMLDRAQKGLEDLQREMERLHREQKERMQKQSEEMRKRMEDRMRRR